MNPSPSTRGEAGKHRDKVSEKKETEKPGRDAKETRRIGVPSPRCVTPVKDHGRGVLGGFLVPCFLRGTASDIFNYMHVFEDGTAAENESADAQI